MHRTHLRNDCTASTLSCTCSSSDASQVRTKLGQVQHNDVSAGALSSFIPDGRERRQVMEAVGDACEQQGQMEAARELYLAAPNPCAALRIINRQLSDLIKPAITDQAASKPATASQV